MANRFRIFRSPMMCHPKCVEELVRAAVVLHNFLLYKDPNKYASNSYVDHMTSDGELVEGTWRSECGEESRTLTDLPPVGGMIYPAAAKKVRDTLCDYFSNEGQVPWKMSQVLYDGHVAGTTTECE